MSYIQRVPAVERALQILERIAERPEGSSPSDLMEGLGLSRTGTFALLNTLKAHGYLEQAGPRGRYRLGPRWWTLAARAHPERTLRELFRTEAQGFSESIALVRPAGDEGVVIEAVPGRYPLIGRWEIGERFPLSRSAAGWVFLADRQAGGRWERIRRKGIARRAAGSLLEIAAPICPDGRRPYAALAVRLPATRASPALSESLRAAAARLSHRLGAPTYQPYAVEPSELPLRRLRLTEIAAFLEGPWIARLIGLRADGRPYAVPVWYVWERPALWIAAFPGSRWPDYVRTHPRITLLIDEPWPPLRRVRVEGEALPLSFPEGPEGLIARLTHRYRVDWPLPRHDLETFRILPERMEGRRGLIAS
ncbi:helix-turn-helix domain-containing protein [Thermoflexus sp.]|uniref:helix-turn-helix domain-containing protein n=1 Tax=Thermoflexus sp. TaxID=1969742 RepID=UPI0025F80248|nr:helix-turn-helix domain-containing protein [Thermoflexus sp.]MCS6962596.1 helix-turn-helix domain-containing protein [Thermoflexus sp.]MCX7690192.1 helix-turn-helix domain-containing protein [Thermoflexus sp.]MDW8183732.1 helix-turn-helix domain-containing protein [Anaerolineae bacterium]